MRSNGYVVAAAVYVAAVTILLAVSRDRVPSALSARMRVREVEFLARLTQPDSTSPAPSACKALSSLPLGSKEDRWTAVAACLRLGEQDVVWRLLMPIADSDPLARVVVQWSFDAGVHAARRAVGLEPAETPPLFTPRPVPDPQLLERAMALGVDEGLRTEVTKVIAHLTGNPTDAQAQLAMRKWREAVETAAFVAGVMLALLAAGVALWLRSPRWALGQDPWSLPSSAGLLPVTRVLVWFMAIHVTMSVMVPSVIDRAGYVAEPAFLMLVLTITGGIAAVALVHWTGATMPGERTLQALGFLSSHGPLWRSLAWGAATFAMAWPLYLGSTIVALRLGIVADTEPTYVYLSSTATGLLAIVVIAPLVEEPLFRGFLFRRLTTRFSVPGAAAISGALFALAHMSLPAFLPLAAIGFSLAIGYARTRDILTPLFAHAAWNLSQAGMILVLYG